MIATPALLSPAPGASLPAIAGGIGNPAVAAEGSEAAGAGSGTIGAVSFSALLAGSEAPVSATIVPRLVVSTDVVAASPQSTQLAANPVAASPTAQSLTRPIAKFFAVMAQSAPNAAPAATGTAQPSTGKVLPPAGIASQIALAMPFVPIAIPGSGPADDVTLPDNSAPEEPAATDAPAPAIALWAIPTSLMLPQPPEPAPGDLGQTPQTAQRVQRSPGEPAPIEAKDAVRAAMAAPLSRLAVDAPQLPVAATVQVALPISAAQSETSGVRRSASLQPTLRGRVTADAAVPDSGPADRLASAPRELAQASPALPPAPLIAPFMPAAQQAPGDPSVAAPSAPVSATERVDFATLVDTIARAREHASPQAMTAPVSVSLAHADFGPVALRFRHEGDALAVTMASADPGFALAASAAANTDANIGAGQRQQPDTQPRAQQPDERQPPASMSGSANQGSAQSQPGFGQGDPRQPSHGRPAMTASRGNQTAADPGHSDPDIFA